MSIKLQGATSGSIELDVPAAVSGGDISLTLPDSVGSAGQYLRNTGTAGTLEFANGGKILQVVEGSTSTDLTVSTTTYTDTGLSASITPSSTSSKIFVVVNQHIAVSSTTAGKGGGIRILRDSTVIHDPVASATGPFEFYHQDGFYWRASITKLDSPATASSITYKTQGRPYSTSNLMNVRFQYNDASANATSYITLIEVAA